MKPPFIYALVDPAEPSHIRYIGMTMVNPRRPQSHAKRARFKGKARSHVVSWVRTLQAEGRNYDVILLKEFSLDTPLETVYEAEQDFINAARARGDDLTNKTDGGPGCLGVKHSAESRALQGIATRERCKDPAVKAILSEAQKRRYDDPAEREKSSKLHKGRKISEATRSKLIEAARKRKEAGIPGPTAGMKQSNEQKEKTRQRMLGNTYTLGFKHSLETIKGIIERQTGSKRSQETKALMSEVKKANWAAGVYDTKEYHDIQVATHLGQPAWNKGKSRTEEEKRNMKEGQRRYHATRILDTEVSPTERLARQLARSEKKLAKLKAKLEQESE